MSKDQFPALAGLSRAEIERAQLPALYIAARNALQACARVDECKDLQDKYSALARYAKQAQNKELLFLAQRIALRAERRIGELLHTLPTSNKKGQGRTAAAAASGLNVNIAFRAMAIARVPEEEFEAVVESANPPGREKYAAHVRHKQPDRPNDKRRSALGALKRFVKYWEAHPPESHRGCFDKPEYNSLARDLLTKVHEHSRAFARILTEGPAEEQ